MTAFDPRAVFETLGRHGVDYILIGGTGGVLHGSPLLTADVDIVPEMGTANLEALAAALNDMSARIMSQEEPAGIAMDFTAKNLRKWIVEFRFLNLMTDHGQVDVVYRPGGTGGYQDLNERAELLQLGAVDVRVAALEDIIRSKQAVGRQRDLEQLPTLRLLMDERKKRGQGRPSG